MSNCKEHQHKSRTPWGGIGFCLLTSILLYGTAVWDESVPAFTVALMKAAAVLCLAIAVMFASLKRTNGTKQEVG